MGQVRDPRPAHLTELRPGIVCVDLESVTAENLTTALPALERARGIIFDLRGSAGPLEVLQHLSRTYMLTSQHMIPVLMEPDQLGTMDYRNFWTPQWKVRQ